MQTEMYCPDGGAPCPPLDCEDCTYHRPVKAAKKVPEPKCCPETGGPCEGDGDCWDCN
jgi:hypothetical protein